MSEVSIKKAVAYTAIAKYSTAVLQLVFAAILSRLLTPEQYGTVAVIHVFVIFFQLFCDMGFGPAVIQDKELTQKQTNDIFSWTVYLGIGLMLLFVVASFPISKIYDDSIYIPLGAILSTALLLNALNMIPNAVMLKEKRFKSITFRTITASIVASLLTIILAYKGFGVYALVLQSVLTAFIIFLWNEASVRLRLNIVPDIAVIKRIWGYSFYQFLSQFINYFNRNLDSLLIGKFFPKADLGQYNKSYHLIQMPISYIPGVVGPALHPILSDHQNAPEYIYSAYLRILKILSIIGCFVAVWLYYVGGELVIILFGNQWHPAIIPFKILALSIWFQLLTNTLAPIYQSIGNTKLMFKSTVYSGILIFSFIVLGCILGTIIKMAICVSSAYILNFFLTYFILVKIGFKGRFVSFLKNFTHEALFFVILMAITFIPFSINNLLLSLIVKSICIILVYFFLILISGEYKIMLGIIKRKK